MSRGKGGGKSSRVELLLDFKLYNQVRNFNNLVLEASSYVWQRVLYFILSFLILIITYRVSITYSSFSDEKTDLSNLSNLVMVLSLRSSNFESRIPETWDTVPYKI